MSDQVTGQPGEKGSDGVTRQPDGRFTGAGSPALGGAGANLAGPSRNEMILFFASFMTLIAAGMGFAIRGAILSQWGEKFGFTQSELGDITGGGLTGFCAGIFLFSFLTDRIGYGWVMVAAFLLHLISAVLTLAATPLFNQDAEHNKHLAALCLYWGSFIFSMANGTCEAVINPLTATLFSRNKTHWLNILHAGWPGGLILGALLGVIFVQFDVRWEIQIATFLVPTLLYGVLMIGRKFPRSESSAAGVSLGTMLLEFVSPILLCLLVLHALVGSVELGTDSWISNITGTIMENKTFGLLLFIWTSGLMFVLRFFAGPIVHRISPLGLLFVSALLGCSGLLLLGAPFNTSVVVCVLAATVYGFGKTFLWPTMLGVVSERYPKGGAITLGVVGGVGMLSAGFLGGPGIGYGQDYAAVTTLKETSPEAYERYKADSTDGFLMFPKISGLDNSKKAVLADNGEQLQKDKAILAKSGRKLSDDKNLDKLNTWWESVKDKAPEDKDPVMKANLHGGKQALTWTAAIPAAMAVGYLLLILYFRLMGGYQAQVLTGHAAKDEEYTGGTEGPGEG